MLAEAAKEVGPDLLAFITRRKYEPWDPKAGVPVTIETTPPGAALLLGDRDLGPAPWSGLLPAGAAEVKAVLPGYRSVGRQVTFQAPAGGGRQVIGLTLEPDVGGLRVQSEPPGATIFLDGQAVGRAPWRGRAVNPGAHRVVARLEGYDEDAREVEVVAGGARSVTLRPSRAEGALHLDARRADGRPLVATIFIDGQAMGQTPSGVLKLAAGSHRVELRDPRGGLAPVAQTVDVPARESVQRVLTFERRAAPAGRAGVTARLSLAEGAIVGAAGTLRSSLSLEAGVALELGWLQPELAAAVTLEDPTSVILRPGAWWVLGPMYVRTAPQLMLTPYQGTGVLVGPGVELALGGRWRLAAEADASLWFAGTGVAQYRACVDAGACSEPDTGSSCNWGVEGRDAHPMNCVDRDQASAFAAWVRGRLPSEAEWEYAARSGGRDQAYPWGDDAATCARAVMYEGGFGCGRGSTWPVCSKPEGNSAQGVCDLAGNVWEWVEDVYDSYAGAPTDGSARTSGGPGRVNRGGGWSGTAGNLRAASRDYFDPGWRYGPLGFRPARSVP